MKEAFLRFSSSFCLIPLTGLLIAGCSLEQRGLDRRREVPRGPISRTLPRVNTQTLRDDGDIASFVNDIARGNDTKWRLGPHASQGAKRAWHNKEPIEAVGYELRDGQAWWGCTVLDALRKGIEEHRVAVTAEREGAAATTVNMVIEKAQALTSTEVDDLIEADCSTR